jgi:TM2 domain-containing membrane protein YozV
MSDESNNPWTSTGTPGDTPTNPEPAATDRVGFCQDCGRPLTQATVRNVGTGVFCEPCLTARAGVPTATPGYTTVPNYTAAYGTIPTPPHVPGEPHPVLAAILGFIPGVGAIYNGQYAKGIAHVAIFAVLVSLSDNVNGIFGLFVAGWEFYMAFEAYHTAKARLEGLPLPNAFGLNDIGERMGFGKSWGTVGSVKPAGTATPPSATAGYAATPVPDVAAAVATGPDWVGYVPPTAFASAAAQQEAMAAQLREQALRDAGFHNQPPYAPTYTGPGYATAPAAAAFVPAPTAFIPEPPTRRFPVGAIWLIALGLLILLANLIPDWQMSERWWPPILFAGLSAWLFTRRLRSGTSLVCIIRWPVILMTLAILFALHAAYFAVTFGLTCAVLLIVFGALLLLERTIGTSPIHPAAATSYSVVPPATEPEATRAVWPAAAPGPTSTDADSSKGGN